MVTVSERAPSAALSPVAGPSPDEGVLRALLVLSTSHCSECWLLGLGGPCWPCALQGAGVWPLTAVHSPCSASHAVKHSVPQWSPSPVTGRTGLGHVSSSADVALESRVSSSNPLQCSPQMLAGLILLVTEALDTGPVRDKICEGLARAGPGSCSASSGRTPGDREPW